VHSRISARARPVQELQEWIVNEARGLQPQGHKMATRQQCALSNCASLQLTLHLRYERVKMKMCAEGTWCGVLDWGSASRFNRIEIGLSNSDTISDTRTSGACVRWGDL
jgi:hypothetical protein